jgi:hypothetical protein
MCMHVCVYQVRYCSLAQLLAHSTARTTHPLMPCIHFKACTQPPTLPCLLQVEQFSEELQRPYFYNQETRQSQWERPPDLSWRRIRVKAD